MSRGLRGWYSNKHDHPTPLLHWVPAIATLPGGSRLLAALAVKSAAESRQVYTRIGLRPIINAAGTYTHLGGSLMPPEVIEAMNDAAQNYVPIRELSRAAGDAWPNSRATRLPW